MLFSRKFPDQDQATWVKICGLRDLDSARQVLTQQPDAIGLNFYPRSSRFVSDDQAREIVRLIPEAISVVGVFVNEPVSDICRRVTQLKLQAVQFHGDETPAQMEEFHRLCPQTEIIQVVRYGSEGLRPGLQQLYELAARGVPISACLIDAQVSGSYGGTGAVLPWGRLREELNQVAVPPVILAGGLEPANVSAAIKQVRPRGVDVASGVESAPGVKDPVKVAAFLAACRRVEK